MSLRPVTSPAVRPSMRIIEPSSAHVVRTETSFSHSDFSAFIARCPRSPVSSRKRSSSVARSCVSSKIGMPLLGRERADRLQRGAVDDHRVGPPVGDDAGALLLEQRAQLVEARRAHEDRPPVALDEVGQRALHDEPAGADHDDAVDGLLDLGQHVAGDQHRAALGGERDEDVAQPAHALRVQAVGGLVEHEDLRVAEQRGAEREALAHAHRVALHAAVAGGRQLDHVEHLVDARVRDARPPPRSCAGGRGRSGRDARRGRRARRRPPGRGWAARGTAGP